MIQTYFEYSDEVKLAIQAQTPILALESTLITHGIPYPHNIEIAQEIEAIARRHGATPATIAIMQGKIKIGLSADDLQTLVHDTHCVKASTRDLAYLLHTKCNAGTTVASTLFCARQAGIQVFATGGLGGVHRGGDQDISADLIELSRTPMALICAGAKAILDIPKTLEFLETYSIPVIGYRTDRLPLFYSTSSMHELTAKVDEISELVSFLHIHWKLGMPSGVVIANPINEADEIPNEDIEPIIAAALKQADAIKLKGKAVTPFLLSELAKYTQGKSVQTNLQLIKNNVSLGAELAVSLKQTVAIERIPQMERTAFAL